MSRDRPPLFQTYIIIHVFLIRYVVKKRVSPSLNQSHKICFRLRPFHRGLWHCSDKGWSSDFPPPQSAFSSKYSMAFLLQGHNGVHCCGTVGDSHSSSQLSTAKCTFTGDSFQNHAAKVSNKIENNA